MPQPGWDVPNDYYDPDDEKPESCPERDAKLVEELMAEKPYCDQPWARMALAVAARAIRRGRHLTDREKMLNLADAFDAEGDAEIAAKIRATAN